MKRASYSLVALLAVSAMMACASTATSPNGNDAGAGSDAGVELDARVVVDGAATPDAGTADATPGNTTQRPITSAQLATLTAGGIATDMPLKALLASIAGTPKVSVLMKSFNASLGVQCSFCHSTLKADGTPDFGAPPSAKMKIATRMWDEWVGKLKFTDASKALYCDSCHQGKPDYLDRADKDELSGWMKTNFVQGLTKKAGGDNSCVTCHGVPFESKFLTIWGGGL